MRQHVLSAVIALLIVGFLGASFMMIAPVEEADAWPAHPCCEYYWLITPLGGIIWVQDCDPAFHKHVWSCGYVCPSS